MKLTSLQKKKQLRNFVGKVHKDAFFMKQKKKPKIKGQEIKKKSTFQQERDKCM